jgi:hypothetical protein
MRSGACGELGGLFGSKHLGGAIIESTIDLTSQDTYVDGVPRETFRYLREHDPVHWTEEPSGGRGFWSLTKYDDVLLASRSTQLFSSRLGIRIEDMDPEETVPRWKSVELSGELERLRSNFISGVKTLPTTVQWQ